MRGRECLVYNVGCSDLQYLLNNSDETMRLGFCRSSFASRQIYSGAAAMSYEFDMVLRYAQADIAQDRSTYRVLIPSVLRQRQP
jgi:hypothetical protein